MRGIRMTANVKHIQFKSIGWGGSETRVIHMKQISSCYYGYKKPWRAAIILVFILTGPCSILLALLLGADSSSSDMDLGMFGVAGIIPGFSIAALIGLIYYALKKTMTVAVVEVSGFEHVLVFKGSVLEGITLNEQSSAQASEIIQWLADQAQSPT